MPPVMPLHQESSLNPWVIVDWSAGLPSAPESGNDEGVAQYQKLDRAWLEDQWLGVSQWPFLCWIEDEWVLAVNPEPDDPAHFRLEWLSLSDSRTRLALYQSVSRAINASLVLEDIFDALADVLHNLIRFDEGRLIILDDTQNSVKLLVDFDNQGQALMSQEHLGFIGQDALISTGIRQPKSLAIQPQGLREPSVLVNPSAEHALVVPLISKRMVIGFIGLSANTFHPQALDLLSDIAESLAVAVENARLYWQTQNQASREFLINQVTKAIRQTLDVNQILQTTVEEVGRVLGVSRCVIHYWQRQGTSFEYTLSGVTPIQNLPEFLDFEYHVFMKRQPSVAQFNPFVLNDCNDFPEAQALFNTNGLRSFVTCPIILSDTEFVGTISLHQTDMPRTWLDDELTLLRAIAEHVSLALVQGGLFQEKEDQRQQLESTIEELQTTQMHLIQSEKMAVLGQFVAGIAHEVNTPLGTIRANEDTVKRCMDLIKKAMNEQPDELLTAATQKYFTTALDLLTTNAMATDRIQEIVRNLRNFARLDESDIKRVDIHEGLDATLLLIQHTLQGRITIKTEYGNIPPVDCFPGLLNQVFLNLLVNAVQSIPDKGSITLSTQLSPDNSEVWVTVSDTGKGIAPEHMAKIFDPGFTTKGVGVGTGLGLALSYKIMEKHHGSLDVTSVVGQGTRMTVRVPVRSDKLSNDNT